MRSRAPSSPGTPRPGAGWPTLPRSPSKRQGSGISTSCVRAMTAPGSLSTISEVVAARAEGLDHVFVSTGSVGLPNFSALKLFTSRDFAAREPQAVAVLQAVVGRAAEALKANRERAAAIWVARLGEADRPVPACHSRRQTAALCLPNGGISAVLASSVRGVLGEGLRRDRRGRGRSARCLGSAQGQRTSGGRLMRIASALPPVLSPNSVPRS